MSFQIENRDIAELLKAVGESLLANASNVLDVQASRLDRDILQRLSEIGHIDGEAGKAECLLNSLKYVLADTCFAGKLSEELQERAAWAEADSAEEDDSDEHAPHSDAVEGPSEPDEDGDEEDSE